MGLNEIKVPRWARRPMEHDSLKSVSHVWAGRSVGQEQVAACDDAWFRRGHTFEHAPAKLQAIRDLPQLSISFFFLNTEPGKAGLTAHLQHVWTLFNLTNPLLQGVKGGIVSLRSVQNEKKKKRQLNEIICSEGGCILLLDEGDKKMQSHTNIKVHVYMHTHVHTHMCTLV